MGQVISFQTKKHELLRDALEKAEGQVDRSLAEVEWLQRRGAPLADVVKASMNVEKAMQDHRQRELALARLFDLEMAEESLVACE